MKAAIALLSDYTVQNAVRRMVYEIGGRGETEFFGSLLPAHVSLKQPFSFESMDALEGWFDSFSRGIAPFRIELDRIYYSEWNEHAIVGLDVRETAILRSLHNQINRELKELVQDPTAPHDGEDYHFHLTIELGKAGKGNPFRRFYESLPEKHVNFSFLTEYIALFFYMGRPIEPGSFICYRVLPLTG
jgi:2'-5' RNA ligase